MRMETSENNLCFDIVTKKINLLCFHFLLSDPATAYHGMEVILPSSQPQYFQGEELPRTSSPFGMR